MNIAKRTLFILIIASTISIINAKDLIMLGFNGQKFPSAEKSFDKILRQQLSVTADIQLIDNIQTQKIKHYINFDENFTLSAEDIFTLRKYVTDSTYFLWGSLDEFKISPKRKFFFKAQIQGELSVELNFYNLSEQKSSYTGKIKATVAEDRGIVIFTPVNRAVHISALDRTDIIEKINNEAVNQICTIIAASVRSDLARTNITKSQPNATHVYPADTVQKHEIPNEKTTPVTTDSSAVTPVNSITDTSKQIKRP